MEEANQDEEVPTTEPGESYASRSLERFIFAQERLITPENDHSIVTINQLAITLEHFALVQLGSAGSIATNQTLCPAQDCRPQKRLVKCDDPHGGLKANSVPDDASGVNLKRSKCVYSIGRTSGDKDDHGKDQQAGSPSDEATEIEFPDVERRMPLISKHGSLTGQRCECVMKALEELQDNGRFKAHDELSCRLLEYYTEREDHDMIASVMIERGVASYYANDLKTSRRLYKAVIRMGNKLQNRSLLQGRAYVQLAVVYRYEFGKAIQFLEKARQLLISQEPGEDTAEMLYYFGLKYLYLYWSSFSEEGRSVLRAQAKEYLEKAIAHCTKDERSRVQLKKKRYFSLRLAGLYLDCGTRAARQNRRVTNEDIEQAKAHLDFVEQLSADSGMPGGTKIQLLKARTDQYFREGRFDVAMETAKRALCVAKRINMRLEVTPLNERIEECAKSLETVDRVEPAQFHDSGWSAESSNSSE